MGRVRLRLPSPALVVASIAVVLAMAGTGYAAFKVGTSNIKNGAVTSKKIKNGAVTTSKIKNGAVTAGKINTSGLTVPNALNANSAGTAGSAGNANTVGGQSVKKFFFTSTSATTALTTVATIGPFTLQGGCSGSNPELHLTSSTNDWDTGGDFVDASGTTFSNYSFNNSTAEDFGLTHGGDDGGGTVTAVTPDGHVMTVVYQADSTPTLGTSECDEAGTASGS